MNPITNMKNLNKMNDREIDMGVAGTSKSWHHEVSSNQKSNFKRFHFWNKIISFFISVQRFSLDICRRVTLRFNRRWHNLRFFAIWRNRSYQLGSWSKNREIKRIRIRLLRRSKIDNFSRGQLEWHETFRQISSCRSCSYLQITERFGKNGRRSTKIVYGGLCSETSWGPN